MLNAGTGGGLSGYFCGHTSHAATYSYGEGSNGSRNGTGHGHGHGNGPYGAGGVSPDTEPWDMPFENDHHLLLLTGPGLDALLINTLVRVMPC